MKSSPERRCVLQQAMDRGTCDVRRWLCGRSQSRSLSYRASPHIGEKLNTPCFALRASGRGHGNTYATSLGAKLGVWQKMCGQTTACGLFGCIGTPIRQKCLAQSCLAHASMLGIARPGLLYPFNLSVTPFLNPFACMLSLAVFVPLLLQSAECASASSEQFGQQ